MILTWELSSCIENSLIEFLRNEVTTHSLQLLDVNGVAKTVNVYAGRELNNDWNLPLVQVYIDSKPDANRLEIGSNKRLRSFQVIIDIRTLLPGQETNLADWVEEHINNGITVYDYTPNSSNPDVPSKVILGHGRVDFVTSMPVPSYDDADKFDQNRYRITIKIWFIQGGDDGQCN
jgi:hypothetical protein